MRALDVQKTQEGRDNVPRFLPNSYDIWYTMIEVFDTVSLLYRIFFPKELASYFKESEPELKRICNVTTSLSNFMPEFKKLMDDVLLIIKAV